MMEKKIKHDWELLSNNKAAVWEVDEKPNQTLKGYASEKALDIKHRFRTTISVKNGKELVTHFYIVLQGKISILGKETAKHLGILKLGLHISTIEEETPFPKNQEHRHKTNSRFYSETSTTTGTTNTNFIGGRS
nr:unnamed protein product [Callosobruchus chinensis]